MRILTKSAELAASEMAMPEPTWGNVVEGVVVVDHWARWCTMAPGGGENG